MARRHGKLRRVREGGGVGARVGCMRAVAAQQRHGREAGAAGSQALQNLEGLSDIIEDCMKEIEVILGCWVGCGWHQRHGREVGATSR